MRYFYPILMTLRSGLRRRPAKPTGRPIRFRSTAPSRDSTPRRIRGDAIRPRERRRPGESAATSIRRCEFTTGAFIEPIEVWNEPHLLRFSVTSNPQPMRELSPYGPIDAPHLTNFLVSHRGQFALRSLPDGRTEVIGSTWYQHHLWPAAYWRVWSDAIIHRIHLRVLRHVRELSETKPRMPQSHSQATRTSATSATSRNG